MKKDDDEWMMAGYNKAGMERGAKILAYLFAAVVILFIVCLMWLL